MIWSSGKCNDCGEQFDTERRNGRPDVCDSCWENRNWLVTQPSIMALHIEEFRKIQKAMACGRGTAKKQIEALKQKIVASHPHKEGEGK
jgi:hypothetical protein